MNSAIKTLEEIGQNASLKQHDSLLELLECLNIKDDSFDVINRKSKEFVCMLIPEDDDNGNDDNDNDDS